MHCLHMKLSLLRSTLKRDLALTIIMKTKCVMPVKSTFYQSLLIQQTCLLKKSNLCNIENVMAV